MPKPEKKDIWFDSSDGVNRVSGLVYSDAQTPPRCILQISHGMCEYIRRYEAFAGYLVQRGVVVCGNDHIGHGNSSAEEDYGYFTEKGGRRFAVQDLKTMNQKARELYPGLPLVLLGHSMGSFLARQYAANWPETIDGLIISGTAGRNSLAALGAGMASLVGKIKGDRHRSSMIEVMAFGSYLHKIENPKTKYDWVSRDVEIVKNYVGDSMCNFLFTANGFEELFNALRDVSGPEWAAKIPPDLPVLMISGDADPVGAYGKGPEQVRGWLEQAGVKDLTCHMYPGARHEVLNETNRQQVYEDVEAFLRAHWLS